MPMDLQLNVAAFNAALRLASLPSHHPLAPHVVKCQSRAPRYFKSPLHKLFLAFPGLLDVETIDSTPRMTTWTAPLTVDIASSREDAMRRVADLENSGTFVVFSDGSGEDNNVGAAAVATNVDGEVRVQRAYLGTLDEHTVFEAELFGVVLALRIVEETRDALDVAVCLDNQSAIQRTHDPRPKSGQLITSAIHTAVEELRARRPDFRLRLVWVPGHEGVDGNELADLHAKKAAAREDTPLATLDDDALPDSIAALRAKYKRNAQQEWKERWAASERGRRYARFDASPPSARVARMYHRLKRADAALLTQLRTGHVALNQYLHRIQAVDSPLCGRCDEIETVDHLLLRCPRYLAPRQVLRSQLKGQVLSTRALLGSPRNHSALMAFIHSTGRLALRETGQNSQSQH